jgi:porin
MSVTFTLNSTAGRWIIPVDPTGLSFQWNLPGLQNFNPFGVYINFQQQLTGTETDPGTVVFLNVSQADQTTAAVDRQISLGTQYHGPFGRHDDSVALALGWTDNNSYYANYISQQGQNLVVGSGNEFDSELYYSYAPITALFLRPNLQYIMQPGGTTANSNAFVFGLKSGVTF